MALTLYAHPFAAYCWKVLIALYEGATPFVYRRIDDAAGWGEVESLWPIRKLPLLRDGEELIAESTIIVEYLTLHYPSGKTLLPVDHASALPVRFMDRFFDNYVMAPMQRLVADRMRADDEHDESAVAEANTMLERAYAWLERRLSDRGWAAGEVFSLADCAAAPALFYADWVYPIAEQYPRVRAYRSRLLAHPTVARVVEEARPYRGFFPRGAPPRD